MGKKFIPLAIICLLVVTAGGCSKKTASPAVAPAAGLQNQPANPVTTAANPATTLPQPAATGQVTTNQAPALQSQGPLPLKESQLISVASMLHAKANIPVLMPLYWPPVPSNNRDRYCGIQYGVGPDGYSATLTTVSKPLPVNSPELNMPPNDAEANQWGNFGGVRIGTPGVSAPNSGVVQKPEDGQPSVIGGYRGWQDQLSFYWESGTWQCEVLSSMGSPVEDARELTGSFKEAGELQGLQAKSGKILVSDANHQYTFISWVSADGRYEYNLQYDGKIADAIKIANSFSEVKQE
jgi:hypothetical protein